MDVLEICAKMIRDAVGTMSTKFSAHVKDEINTKVSSLYKPGGAATLATLPALTADNAGYVYDMSEAFTTNANFREGAGHKYPAGTNVVISDVGGDVYKYDVLSGMLDSYVQESRKVGNVPLSADIPVTLTGDTAITVTNTGTASTIGYSVAHNDSGVTAGSKGDATNQTPGFGGTFKALSVTVDAKGHVTTLSEHSNKIPDTKATTSADGLMSKEDKAKLDEYTSKGSTTKGVYIDASGSPQPMTHELNADIPENFAPATTTPLMDGTAAVGSSVKYAREDHVHSTDETRASADDVTALRATTHAWIQYAVGDNIPDFIVSTNADDEIYSVSGSVTPRGGTRGVSDPVIFANRAGTTNYPGCYAIIGKTREAVTLAEYNAHGNAVVTTQTTPAGNVVYTSRNSGSFPDANHTTRCVVNGQEHILGIRANAADNSVSLSGPFLAVVDAILFGDVAPVGGTGSVVWRENRNRVSELEAQTSALRDKNALLRELINGIDAPVYREASGNPATFADGYPANVKALSVTITPTQSGSGDPSPDNVRPISGATSVGVTRTGKNLLELVPAQITGSTLFALQADGTFLFSGAPESSVFKELRPRGTFPLYLPQGDYILSGVENVSVTSGRVAVYCYRVVDGQASGESYYSNSNSDETRNGVSFHSDGDYWSINLMASAGTYANVPVNPMIRLASAPGGYEQYAGQSATVSLVDSNSDPLTVYGGTLNVTTGELSVTHKTVELPTSNWYTENGNRFTHANIITGVKPVPNITTTIAAVCSHYKASDQNTTWKSRLNVFSGTNGGTIYIVDTRFSTAEDFMAWLAENETPVQVCYELATPVTYQLTPAQLATLSGYNAVTTDAGTLSVTYRADPSITLGGG